MISSKGPRAMLPEEATLEQLEKAHEKVMKLFDYIKEYDEDTRKEMGDIKNPAGIIILIQSTRKFKRGSDLSSHVVAIGSINPPVALQVLLEWSTKTFREAMAGEEIT